MNEVWNDRRLGEWRQVVITLVVAMASGYNAATFDPPMPWLIGPLLSIGALSLGGTDVRIPHSFRNWMIAVISLSLGAAFVPGVFGNLGDWAVSLIVLVFSTIIMMGTGALIARRWFGLDPRTAMVCAAPGAMSQVLAIGETVRADMGPVLVVHMIRIILIVLVVPASILVLTGYQGEAIPSMFGPADAPMWASAWLVACLLGYPLAEMIGLPTASLTGPMIVSGLMHYFGVIAVAPPGWSLAVAQVVLGASIAAEIGRIPRMLLLRYISLAIVITIFASAVGLVLAAAMSVVTGIDMTVLILAYMPGSTPEMVIAEILVGSDPAFVSVHHLTRLLLIIFLGPVLLRVMRD